MLYYQCEFIHPTSKVQTVGWIEERGAREGSLVELKDCGDTLWRVAKVYKTAFEATELKAKQDRDRGFGASIR